MAFSTRPRKSTHTGRRDSRGSDAYLSDVFLGGRSPTAALSSSLHGLPSPAAAQQSSGGLVSSVLHRWRRRTWLRSAGAASALGLTLWLVLLYLGAFDTDPQIPGVIDPYTLQVLPGGDPRRRPEIEYKRPGDYWQFVAEWNKPSYELLANSPPSKRECDKSGPLLFIGLFSHPGGAAKRQILRAIFKPDLEVHGYRIEYKFIVGKPPDDDWRRDYGDIAILEDVVKDNIDEGKTLDYFKWLVKHLPSPKPQFVMKMDDDTFLVMPNVIRDLRQYDCSKALYWGTTQGAAIDPFGKYMRGLCYGMSWPLASWIGTANVSNAYAAGTEDARIGRIVRLLDPVEEPVQWVDHGWKMGDWDQLTINVDTIGFHWLKLDNWTPMVKRRALKAWADAGREYRWDWDQSSNGREEPRSVDETPSPAMSTQSN